MVFLHKKNMFQFSDDLFFITGRLSLISNKTYSYESKYQSYQKMVNNYSVIFALINALFFVRSTDLALSFLIRSSQFFSLQRPNWNLYAKPAIRSIGKETS